MRVAQRINHSYSAVIGGIGHHRITLATAARPLDPALRLRPPGPGDEVAFRAACDALAEEGFNFGGSRAVIEACGGQLKAVVEDARAISIRRYWID